MKLPAILIILLLVLPAACFAEIVSEECADVSPYDYEGLMACELDTYASSGNKVMSAQFDFMLTEVVTATKGESFDITKSADYYQIFRYLFGGLLVLIASLTGYKYMMSNEDPTKREEARRSFKFIILSGILVAMLPLIIWETSEFSKATNAMVMGVSELAEGVDSFNLPTYLTSTGTGVEQSVNRFSDIYTNVPFFITSAKAYVVSMNARHLLILMLVAISPMILLMYIFDPTKPYGKLLCYLFAIELFYPAISIIVLHFSLILSGEYVNLMMLSSALMLCIVFHAIIILATIIQASITIVNQIRYVEK